MERRFSDKQLNAAANNDFRPRHYGLLSWQLVGLFVVSYVIILLTAWPFGEGDNTVVFCIALFVILVFLTFLASYFTRRSSDIIMATEFQNALFSAAAGLHYRFSIIAKRDGTIVYFDRGSQKVMRLNIKHAISVFEALLQIDGLTDDDNIKIRKAIDDGEESNLFFYHKDDMGLERKMVLEVKPLPRPKGFFLVRCRDYAPRSDEQISTKDLMMSQSSHPMVEQILHNLPIGMYAADTEGNLEFVNTMLEQWLGYEPGEIMREHVTLWQLLGNQQAVAKQMELQNYEGPLTLHGKNGTIFPAMTQQTVLHDEYNTVIGATALVYDSQGAEEAEAQKKILKQG